VSNRNRPSTVSRLVTYRLRDSCAVDSDCVVQSATGTSASHVTSGSAVLWLVAIHQVLAHLSFKCVFVWRYFCLRLVWCG
jgi:hypothetical protein